MEKDGIAPLAAFSEMSIFLLIFVVLLGIGAGFFLDRILLKKRKQGRTEEPEHLVQLGESLLKVKDFRKDPKIRALIDKGIQQGRKKSQKDE